MISTISSRDYSEKEAEHSPINRYIDMKSLRVSAIRNAAKIVHNQGRRPNFRRGSIEARMQSENLGIVFLD